MTPLQMVYQRRPLFASLANITKRDRDAIITGLDHALWWGDERTLTVAVERFLILLDPTRSEKEATL